MIERASRIPLDRRRLALSLFLLATSSCECPGPIESDLFSDELVEADYWDSELRILSAGLGFDGIIGVPNDDIDVVREAGGAWIAAPNCVEQDGPLASTTPVGLINLVSRGPPSTATACPSW
jgi:hypothetical protein